MNAGELQVVIDVDISAFEGAMNTVAGMLSQSASAMQELSNSFQDGGSEMKDSGTDITGTVGKIAGAFLGVVGVAAVLKTSFEGLGGVSQAFNDILKENPIGLVVTLIAGLIAALVVCYEKFDTFRAVVNAVWAVIKDLTIILVDGLIAEFKILLDILEWVIKVFYDLGSIVVNYVVAPFRLLVDAIEALYYATIGHDWGKASDAIKQFGTDAVDSAEKIKDSAVDIVKDTKDMAQNVAKDFTDGYDKITETISHISDDASKAYTSAFEKTKTVNDAKVNVKNFTITPEKVHLNTSKADVQDSTVKTSVTKLTAPKQNEGASSGASQVKNDLVTIESITAKAEERMKAFGGTQLSSLQEQLSGVKKLMDEMISDPAKMDKLKFDNLKAQYDGLIKKIKETEVEEKAHAKTVQEVSGTITKGFEDIGTAMGNIASGEDPSVALKKMLEGWVKSLAQFVEKKGSAYILAGTGELLATGGASPTGWEEVAGGSALVAAGATIQAMKMASGGIVSGSTFANIGEYAGASHNPEVVAPLDKLKGMMGTQHQTHSFEISGDKLVSILSRVDNNSSFALGGGQ